MFRDKDEELKRLEEQLLRVEEPEEAAAPEEYLDEEVLDSLLEEDTRAENAGVYQNFSNNYGKDLRNYASGYKAYNADNTDTDLERFSEEVRQPKKTGGFLWLLLLLVLLLGAVVAAIVWQYVRLGGLL